MRRSLVFCCLALFALSAAADTIYKTEDAQGRVIYSDQPHPGAVRQSQLPPLNTMEPSETRSSAPQPDRRSEPDAIDYQLRIDAPTPESSVPPGQRDLTISVSIEPQLASEHTLAYYQNDQLLMETQQLQLIIEEIFRGSHTLQVAVLDNDGQVISRSQRVVVHVHRPSLNSPARR